MFDIGVPELLLILLIGLVFFGPGKLPELGRALGKSLHEFKNASTENDAAITDVHEKKADEKAKIIDVKEEKK